MTAHFVESILWTLSGLLVGYVIGSAGTQPHKLASRETAVARSRTDVVVGFILLVLAVISVATMSASLNRQEQVVECQAAFNEAFIIALKERTDAATAERAANAGERAAQRAMLDVVLDPGSTPQLRQQAVEQYRVSLVETDRTQAEADATRSQHPLPVRPRCD